MKLTTITTILAVILLTASPGQAQRVKDLASFDGIRDNQLTGYGLVVGLNGTGDSDQTRFPAQTILNAIQRAGVSIPQTNITVKNIAAVMVTATLPPFAKQGNRVDVTVSSVGDAKSIAGGTLIMTPLKGADAQIYAVAQGPVLTNTFSYGGQGGNSAKSHPTVGRVPSGALVEKEVPITVSKTGPIQLNLHHADLTTAIRVKDAVNAEFAATIAECTDPGMISIEIPAGYHEKTVEFMAAIEKLQVEEDVVAKVIINEKTGTVVMGENVQIGTVAVSHGNLTVTIKPEEPPTQPQPAKGKSGRKGKTVPAAPTPAGGPQETKPAPEKVTTTVLKAGSSIQDLVKAMNTLGGNPKDLINILQAIKAAGALKGELEII